MIGTPKLVGLHVQGDQESEVQGRRSLVPGFAVEVIEVCDREKPGGGRVFEGRIFGLGRRETEPPRPYSTPSRHAMRHWWQVETYGAVVPEELLAVREGATRKEDSRLVG
jgi:hypothetical protein